jgi:glucose-6-phosphate 1-epimerase
MNLQQLEDSFAIPGVLRFDTTPSGLIAAHVTASDAEATIFLQGAHLTHWQPAGLSPVLFLSSRSDLIPGKPIRGGVPVIFPWFGPLEGQLGQRSYQTSAPAHGFARTSIWDLAFVASSGGELHLTFTLAPNDASRSLGFDHFKLAYRMVIGRGLTLELTVANEPTAAPLIYEEALHSYFAVADVREATLTGLAGTEYLDKRDEMKRKIQSVVPIRLTGTTDRVYLNTVSSCVIADSPGHREIVIDKSGSHTTVVWNPWAELAANMADMDPNAWQEMLCVETANVGKDRITLEPGQTHTMRAHISVESA